MSAPRLTVPVILESTVRVPDGMGGFQLSWQPVGQLWAEMRSGVGGERFAEVGAQSVMSWRIIVRAARAGDPRRPRPDQRLRMGSGTAERRFRIEAVAESDREGRYLVLTAKEESAV